MNTLILAHYYAPLHIQKMADHVGDSLDLAQKAQSAQAKRIVFAGVRFMAETAKVLNPEAEVILPDSRSSCSLVEDTDINKLRTWRELHPDHVHVMYINSSVEQKTTADWIVTSRNAQDIIEHLYAQGKKVIYSPDRNMGQYLNYLHRDEWIPMPVWDAVCIVHDQFAASRVDDAMKGWTDGPKYLLSHPESPLPLLKKADYIGSTRGMLEWVRNYPHIHASIWVDTEIELIEIMKEERPDLDIRQMQTYTGCQCNACPFMKHNTTEAVERAIRGEGGTKIDYISKGDMERVREPIQRMMEFSS